MKNPLEWTSPSHRGCKAGMGEHTQWETRAANAPDHAPDRVARGMFLEVPYLVNSYLQCCRPSAHPPAQPCACHSPQYSKVERHPVTALEKMMESSFAGPQSFPEVSSDRGSQSVKHHRYRQLIMVEWAHSHYVWLWTTHAQKWQHFRRDGCSCFSCGSPWSGCSSSSQQVNQRHQQAAVPLYKAERSCEQHPSKLQIQTSE